jgi:glutathione peroxidase
MKKSILLAALLALGGPAGQALAAAQCPPLLHYEAKPLRGSDPVKFCEAYQGKVILAVNTASQCGFTPQFQGLEALYQKYKDRGFVVLGFPSNDFKQELPEAEQIAGVCYLNYGVTFPMFAKSAVSGKGANPFFKGLYEQSGLAPQWNFFKYLIGADGKLIKAYPSRIEPESEELVAAIESALAPPEEKPAKKGHGRRRR